MRDSDRTIPGTDERAAWSAAGSVVSRGSDTGLGGQTTDGLVAEVIGRILDRNGRSIGKARNSVPSDRVDMLCDALLSTEQDAAIRMLRDIAVEGVSPDALYLDYIAAAARRMGERWTADCSSFLDVTLAGGRLTGLVRDLALDFGGPEQQALPGHSILIATVPGETHSLGATIAAECFRRARWDVTLLDGAGADESAAQVAKRRFPVVGFSAGGRRMVPVLAETVRVVRRIDPDAVICVGGPILALEPEIVRTVGADHAAADPSILCVLLRRQIACHTLGTGFRHAEI